MYFAVHVTGGKEDSLVALIKERINPDCYQEVFTPKKDVTRKKEGEQYNKTFIIFPGYIFVDSNNINQFAAAMYQIPQYARVLGRDKETGSFLPLSDEECIMIDTLCGKDVERKLKSSFVSVTEGKKIKVIAGPLYGLEGQIKKVDVHRRVCYMDVTLLGKVTTLEFAINLVKEID